MKLQLTCKYCDHKFERNCHSSSAIMLFRCPACGDKNFRVKEVVEDVTDYYIGCPPFASKEDAKAVEEENAYFNTYYIDND